jgi:hypothetical protein
MHCRVIVRGAALAASLTLLPGCGGGNDEKTPPVVEPAAFVREPADRPVVSSGTSGWPSIIADPSVLADQEGYHLFYSAFVCRKADGSYSYSWDPLNPGDCDLGQAFGATAYAFSRDRGLTWEFRATPVVLHGTASWNSGDVETPFALRVADRLYVFYSALSKENASVLNNRYQLGVATLDLGGRSIREALLHTTDVFTLRAEPLIAADFSRPMGINNAQEPSVVVRDGRLELYFVSLGLSLPDKAFDAPGQQVSIALRRAVYDPSLAALEAPSAPLAEGTAANITEVRFFDGRYHLFATTTALEDHEDDYLTHATSEDGLRFSAPKTLLKRRSGTVFDNWGLMAPTAVVEDASTILFYTAWEMQEHACQIQGAGGRMGMPQESRPQAARCLYGTLGRAVAPRASLAP